MSSIVENVYRIFFCGKLFTVIIIIIYVNSKLKSLASFKVCHKKSLLTRPLYIYICTYTFKLYKYTYMYT